MTDLYNFIRRLFKKNKAFGGEAPDEEYKQWVKAELDAILDKGRSEFEEEPPTRYT